MAMAVPKSIKSNALPRVIPLSVYSRGAMAREGLQLGFAAVSGQEIKRGVHQLSIALEELARTHL
jgi:hypothetical protein